MNKYYAGIGSRETPSDILTKMSKIAVALDKRGYILRSGGAKGADSTFDRWTYRSEIFLPSADTPVWTNIFTDHFHPNPKTLTDYGRKLMNRNALQILGIDGNTPVKFVVCWTKDGKASGGTGQAIRIAEYFNIPVFNLKRDGDLDKLREFMKTGEKRD